MAKERKRKLPKNKNTLISGVLEIDHDRGVIYFHASQGPYPPSVLRIQGLPIPIPQPNKLLDVCFGTNFGCSWNSDEDQ